MFYKFLLTVKFPGRAEILSISTIKNVQKERQREKNLEFCFFSFSVCWSLLSLSLKTKKKQPSSSLFRNTIYVLSRGNMMRRSRLDISGVLTKRNFL